MSTTTTRAGLRVPVLTDIADLPLWVTDLGSDTDALLLIWSTGVTASRPASALNGRIYYATNGDRLSYDMGTSWRAVMMQTADGNMTSDVTVNAPGYDVAGVPLAAANLSNGVTGTGAVVLAASPTLTGNPIAPTQSPANNSTRVATTAYVDAAVSSGTGGVASVPIGGSIDWDYAAANIPSWALLQYGQAISRTTYGPVATVGTLAYIANAAGFPHGSGDGTTTFNLADKRGRVSAGKDDMGGSTAGRITAAISGTAGTVLAATVGNEGVSLSTAQLPVHNHGISGTPGISGAPGISDPQHHHLTQSGGGTSGGGLAQTNPSGGVQPDSGQVQPAATGITATVGSLAVSVGSLVDGSVGSGSAHLNVQPTIIVNKIVRAL